MAFLRSSQLCLAILLIVSVSIIILIFQQPSNGDGTVQLQLSPLESSLKSDPPAQCLLAAQTQNLLDISNFKFLTTCSSMCARKPSIIVVVHSAVRNRIKRDVIRGTWGSVKKYRKWTFELVFLLGVDPSLQSEAAAAGDLVIGNFTDSYRNLSYKHLMGYKWVAEFCPGAQLILKTDDDVFLDLFHLIRIIEENLTGYEIIGNLMSGYKPERNGTTAQISYAEYPGEMYPDYVSGMTYVIRTEAACDIFNRQGTRPFLWIDDVFVTGVLREPTGFKIFEVNSEYFMPGPLTQPMMTWYEQEDLTPPPWAFILEIPEFGSCLWEVFGKLWSRTLKCYGLRVGVDFNNS